MNASTSPVLWGPEGKQGSVTISLDNFGPVSETTRGVPITLGPNGTPITVELFDEMLGLIDGHAVTYFIEGLNARDYPEHVKQIEAAGHEVALHGWRHEFWDLVPAHERFTLLQRGKRAFEDIGIDVRGLRPTGGGSYEIHAAERDMANVGMEYLAGVGKAGDTAVFGQIVSTSHPSPHVDAFMLLPEMSRHRQQNGRQREPYSIEEWRDSIRGAVAFAKEHHKHVDLLFHPQVFLAHQEMAETLTWTLEMLRADDELWLPTCLEATRWVRDHHL